MLTLATELQPSLKSPGKKSDQILGTLEAPNHQTTVKIVWFVIKNTFAVSPWNPVTQSKWLWGVASSHLGLMCDGALLTAAAVK